MISKVKSQGKRTVELTVVGRALRLPTHGFPIHITAQQAKRLLHGIYFTHILNQAQSPRLTIDVSGLSQNSVHPPEAGHYRIRAANKRERAGSVRYFADAPGRWQKGLRRLQPSLCCYSRTS
jgi:hypothetical protein